MVYYAHTVNKAVLQSGQAHIRARADYPPQEVEGQRDESVDTRQAGETVTPTGLKRGGKMEVTT